MKIIRNFGRLIWQRGPASIGFHTGHPFLDRVADSICDYLSNGGDVMSVRRYYLRHGAYAPRLFLYLFRYDRTVGDIKKYRNDLDFLAIQILLIDDSDLHASLQRIHESRTVEYAQLLEKKRGVKCTLGNGSNLSEKIANLT